MEKLDFNAIAIRDYYPTYENPGSSIWVYEQVIGLMKHGINSFVISPTPYIPNFIRKYKRYYLYPKPSVNIENYKETYVIRPPYLKLPSRYFTKFNLYFQKKIILNYAIGFHPQLIHAHFGRNGVAAIPLKRKLNIPLVTYFYGDDVGIDKHAKKMSHYYKDLIKYGDLYLALSEDMKKDLINIGFPEEKVVIHHLGIDLNLFKNKPGPVPKNDEKLIICCVGRFHESKGGQDTIQAFNKLVKEINNVELRLVGDGSYINELKKITKNLLLQDKVIFINNFKSADPRGTVLEEMKKSDIFILTPFMDSNGMKTGTPVVLMEAQALNLPCISTNYAGIPEVLNYGRSGIIVEQRNIEQIYEALKMMCLNKSMRIDFGKRGREYVEMNFNQTIQMESLANLYRSEILNYFQTFN